MVLLMVSCVSAQDTSDLISDSSGDVSTTDSAVLQLSANDNVLAAGEGTFTDLAGNISGKTSLTLDKDYVYNTTGDTAYVNGIEINGPLTINGNGFTISGNNAARIFNVASGTLTLNNLIICDGAADNGGAVYVNGGATLNTNDVKFNNNTATYRGGAIWSDGTVNVDYSSFDSNNITYRVQNVDNGGAAIFSNGVLSVDHSSFTNDLVGYVVRSGDHNSPQLIDGVVLSSGVAVINNSYFENNSGCYGGAITAVPIASLGSTYTSLTVENSKFVNNLAYCGAAISINADGNGKTGYSIKNCTFIGNNATGIGSVGYSSAGGAISVARDSEGTIVDSKFYNNSATVGGAVDVSATRNGVKVTIDNCDFKNNTATGSPTRDAVGGAIRINPGSSVSGDKLDVTVKNSNFTDNVAGNGSAIYNDGLLSLSGNKVFSDEAEIVSGEKGTISSAINVVVLDGEVKTIDTFDTTLYANVTDDNGNLIEDAKFNFTINGVEVPAVYNVASKLYEATYALPAAGIYPVNITYVTDKELVVVNGTIKTIAGTYTDLQAKIDAATGSLVLPYNFTYTPGIDDIVFVNGVVIDEDISIDGNGFTICGNDSARIFELTNSAVLTLSDVTVCDGNATNGGAVYVNKGATLNTNDVKFNNNTATYRGGAIWSDGTVNVDYSSFDSNNITYRVQNVDNGGAAIFSNGVLSVDHSSFTNDLVGYVVRSGDHNSPQLIDGVVLSSGVAVINNSYFENNSGCYGGAITAVPIASLGSTYTSLTVENSKFVNNLAYCGAAISINADGNGKTGYSIKNCTFIGNNATGIGSVGYSSAGGAISVARDSEGTIVDSKFYNNSATVGGAVDVSATRNGVKVTIDNCDFKNNTATGSPTRDAVGGAIRINPGSSVSGDKLDVTVKNSNFTDNVAGNGSAIYNDGLLSLSGNKVFSDEAEIVSGEKGTISSAINVVVLDGEVKTIDTFDTTLYANVTDDNGNLIEDAKFNFTINGVEVPAVYNVASKLYEATYALPAAGIYPVNITYVTDKELVVQNGTIKTIKGTFTDLEAKMYGAISSGVLELEYNFIYTPEIDGDTLYNNGILIGGDYPLTINGNNHNISGNDTVAIFHLLDANGIITFNNITFANADCAILVASSNKLNINNCTFINNNDYYDGAPDEGGAISVMGCELVIADSVFINNTGADGGAIFIEDADITVTGSVFTNNTATGDGVDSGNGGAIYFATGAEHTLTVNNCVFTNNSASTSAATPEYVPHGGAINANGRIIITNSNFTDNDAANGSAIYSNGLLTLRGNNISTTVAEIVSGPMGKVISDVYVTVNGNKTIPAYIGDEVVLNATVTDDMGNLIEDSKFNFTVDGKEIPAVPGTGIYTADYKIAHAGETEVSVDYVVTDNLHIETGIYVAPKENATLIITTGQNNKFEYGENVTIFVTLTNDRTGEGLNDTIKVIVNNTEIPVDIINGTASFNVTGFEPGQYPITGIFDGNEIYNTPVYDSSVFEVLRPDRILSIEVEDINFGEIAVINITVTDSKGNKERGTVVLNISGHEFVVVVDGNKSVEIAGLPIGEYSINATLVAEELDTKVVNDTEGFTVYKAASTIEINGTEAITTVENATVIVTVGPEGVTGTVNITVDGEAYGQPVEVIDGQAIVEIPRLANGTHTVTAQYTGDDNYNASEVAEMKVVVSLTPTSFEVEGKGAVYNETAYVIVSGLPKDATGNITATIDGKNFTGDAAIGIIEITGLAVGEYELFGVTYSGDSIYNATSGMASIEITPAASFVIIDPIDDVVYNASVEVNYAIENETEVTVSVYDADGNLIKEGITIEDDKVTISGLNAGEYTIKITNAGDKNHTNSSDVETFTVNKATVTIEPVVTGDKVVDGEVNVTFTLPADVNASSVVVTIDGMPATADLVDGTWVVSFDSLAAGNHTVVVTLTGDTNYKDAVGSATFDIAKVDPEIIIDDIVANVGDYVEVTVTIKGGDATGYLFFNGDLYPVKDGQTTIDVYIEESGIQSIGVFYFGDNKYNNGTALKEFNASKAASTIEINGTEAITTVENATVIVTVGPEGVTGTVNITVDGEAYGEPVEVIDGQAIVEIPGLAAGTHNITAQYTGDDNYNASEVVEMKVVVSLTPTSFEVEGKGAVYNETAYVIVSGLPKDATGNITATIDGKNFTGDAAIGIIEITGLAVGEYELFGVTYSGDSIYNATSGMASIEITPAASFVIIDPIDDVVYNASVEVNYAIENETEVTVSVYDADGNLIKEGITIEDDKVTISGLNAGEYTIKITNAGDKNHTNSSDVETFTVNKATVTIEPVVTGDKVVDGEVNITFTVPKVRDGVVNITIDGNELIGVVIDENGTCTIPGTYGAGNHTVVVTLTGDTNYDDAIGSVTFEVSKVAPETSIDVDDVVAGNDVIITVTVPDDATGAVLFDIDGKTYYAEIKDGKAELVLSDLPADTYNVEYTYQGDDKYLSDSGEDSFKVSLNDTYQIKAESGAIQVGDDATIDVLLPEDAAGEVAVTVDNETYSAPVVNGKAAVTVPGLPAGDYTADVAYSGDDKYAPSSTTVDIDVAKVPNAPIDAEADPAEVGEDAVVEVTLPADATGNVTVTVNGKNYTVPVEDGKATVSVPGLPAGDYTADVAYSGDDKYEPVSTTAPISVDKVSDVPIDVSADPTEVGEDAVIEVSLPEDATGNVTVTVDGKNYTVPVENGKATVTVPELPAGEYAADVVYSGDDKYGPVSTTVPVTVNKVSDANVSANADPVEYGEDAVIEVTLPEDATGVVVASVDGELYAADVENGTATITIPNLPSGNYTTEVTYYGDDKYSPVTTTADIEVISKEEVIAPDVVKYYHGSERFIVYVLKDDKGVANKTVSITLNGVTYNRTTDENGIASLGLNINVGNYTALVKVDGTQINATVTIKSTIAADDVIKMFRNDTQYYATFYDSEGNILPNTEVTFNINGVFYTRKTNDEGVAKLNINLNPGEYIITANNPVTGEMKSNNVTVLSRIVSDDLVKYYRNASQFVVTVFGDDGNPVGAGENVTFNINGVFYTRQTNASGQAKLNINLNPGSYIITTVYKGCSQANDVEVLPVLYADDLVKTYGTSDQFKVLLVDGQGLPYPGQNITLNINGVLYNRVTGLDGYAKLNINLMPGQYIVTSSYGAAVVSNKVTVKA